MILKEKERTTIEDLQTQEKSCVEKYGKYAEQAKDPELKSLFQNLQKKEQEHYDSLSQVLSGTVPQCNCNDSDGKIMNPRQPIPPWKIRTTSCTMRFWQPTASERKS